VKSITRTWLVVIVAALLGLGAGAGFRYWRDTQARAEQQREAAARARDAGPGPQDVIGRAAPDFTLAGVDGQRRTLNDFTQGGGLVLVNFWATWCPPCLREVPVLTRLDRKYGPHRLRIVGIALDNPDRVRKFASRQGIRYPLLAGSENAFEVARRYGDRQGTLPYSVLIGPDGKIRATHMGQLTRDKADALIEPFLPSAADS